MEGVELAPSKSAYLVNQDNEAATKEVQEEVDLTKNLAVLRRRISMKVELPNLNPSLLSYDEEETNHFPWKVELPNLNPSTQC
jgi:hypothetical protein